MERRQRKREREGGRESDGRKGKRKWEEREGVGGMGERQQKNTKKTGAKPLVFCALLSSLGEGGYHQQQAPHPVPLCFYCWAAHLLQTHVLIISSGLVSIRSYRPRRALWILNMTSHILTLVGFTVQFSGGLYFSSYQTLRGTLLLSPSLLNKHPS